MACDSIEQRDSHGLGHGCAYLSPAPTGEYGWDDSGARAFSLFHSTRVSIRLKLRALLLGFSAWGARVDMMDVMALVINTWFTGV